MTFATASNLKRHVRRKHPDASTGTVSSRFVHMVPRTAASDDMSPQLTELQIDPRTTPETYQEKVANINRFHDPDSGEHARQQADRSMHALQAIPVYESRRCRKHTKQIRALQWISQDGADKFEEHLCKILASWGVTPAYTSNCLLISADWANLDPAKIMSLFSFQSCPSKTTPLPPYRYANHQTSLARAIAWFSKWPRNGVELDNFTGAGPFKKMHASHRCHQANCIIPAHIVYEPGEVNEGRKRCHTKAIFLRSYGLEVPELCAEHSPPCMLKLASRTMYEICLIQFSVLRLARGLEEPLGPPSRPPWHKYNTFQHEASNKSANIPGLLQRPRPHHLPKRPEMICRFCKKTKAFHRVTSLWVHFILEHGNLPEGVLLDEVKQTTAAWKRYQEQVPDGFKRNCVYSERLDQIGAEGFSWGDVLAWNLV
ncbi:hypothetical protein F5Y16DRAFT_420725 [Xylariaceae sp. FL0255]|nr:hypothetical protein F5Y16DRAFT_420725 [Xylariaceae sp. FL0255]